MLTLLALLLWQGSPAVTLSAASIESIYNPITARSLDMVRRKGAPLTFTRQSQTQNPDGTLSSSGTSITGYAVQVRGIPDTYLKLGLIESSAPTLFFMPIARGARIKEGDTCIWAGITYTARDCTHIAPDGIVIATRAVVVS